MVLPVGRSAAGAIAVKNMAMVILTAVRLVAAANPVRPAATACSGSDARRGIWCAGTAAGNGAEITAIEELGQVGRTGEVLQSRVAR